MSIAETCRAFLKEGYAIVTLTEERYAVVDEFQRALAAQEYDLAWAHRTKRTEEEHTAFQARCQTVIEPIAGVIAKQDFLLFSALLGPDLHIQTKPFLRISRPGIKSDNIGYHRDTWYGDTPFELAVWLPLTPTTTDSCLWVRPGSHLEPDEAYPYTQYQREDVPQGGLKHSLGFLYAPKRLNTVPEMTPLPVMPGEMIVFSLALLHGQEVNLGLTTRWSVDFRIVNSYAPIKWERSRSGANHYTAFAESPVSDVAHKYYATHGI